MKIRWSFDFATPPLPARWNAIGMIIGGSILSGFTMLLAFLAIYAEMNGSFKTQPEGRWIVYFLTGIFGVFALLFLFVGRILLKKSGPVTDKQLVGSDMLATAFTKPDGKMSIQTGSALPLYLWVGRILTFFASAMYGGCAYVLFFVRPLPSWGIPAYLFGVGTWIMFIGLFFLRYRRKIIEAKARLENAP